MVTPWSWLKIKFFLKLLKKKTILFFLVTTGSTLLTLSLKSLWILGENVKKHINLELLLKYLIFFII